MSQSMVVGSPCAGFRAAAGGASAFRTLRGWAADVAELRGQLLCCGVYGLFGAADGQAQAQGTQGDPDGGGGTGACGPGHGTAVEQGDGLHVVGPLPER